MISGGEQMQKHSNLAYDKPELAREWHPTKNGDLSPFDVSSKSGKEVWWLGKCGHEWKAKIINRTSGKGCPYCSGRYAIVGVNDLLTLNPELARQWNYAKNGVLTPKDVKPKSNRKVWWICEKGHEWEAIIADRTSGKGCPICSGKKVLYGYNDLATNCPEIAEQWNELKNGDLTPQKVTIGSHKKVWWRCNSGHEWQACICDRVNGNGCPYCSGRVAITGINDFSTLYPELVKEWDYEKNGELLPNTVKAHSNIKVWWICELRHSWQAVISDRAEGSGCPFCQAEFKTSFPEQAVLFYLRQFTEAENRFKIGKNEIDVYLPQLKIGIEYDGLFFHSTKAAEKREKTKNSALQNHGINLIRIKESENENSIVDNVIYYVPNHSRSNLTAAIIQLFLLIDKIAKTNFSKELKVNIEKDRIEIYQQYKQTIKSDSLAEKYPDIAKEWNIQKNGSLRPEMFSGASSQRVWWKCSNGHEWQAIISNRTTQRTGCPFCAGKKVLMGFNDLASVCPEIAAQWHPTRNTPLTPENVTLSSNKKVWWICSKGHSYEMVIKNKTAGQGCPYCSGRYAIPGESDLATLYPAIAAQWHPVKNGELAPQYVKPKSNKKVWWICDKGHEWTAKVVDRVNGNGCPYCSGRYVIRGINDLLTVNPELAKEWDGEKNGSLTPCDVKTGSNKVVWWRCSKCGHSWKSSVNNRNKHHACPNCHNKYWE